jgi:hypothetical protein
MDDKRNEITTFIIGNTSYIELHHAIQLRKIVMMEVPAEESIHSQ